MGVLPLEFQEGQTRLTLELDGTETYDVVGEITPNCTMTWIIHQRNGARDQVEMRCRLDTEEEVSIYQAGGVLQRFAKDFLEASNQTNEKAS